ncbi:MAG: 50S ribosomal protein L9 [Candidatus Bipolaricaulia bacterium]
MKVLLIQHVDKLGEVGDVVKVADGYARNYLFPKGLAVEPTPHRLARYRSDRTEPQKRVQERETWARALQERLEKMILEFSEVARGEKGELYGSVRREEIASQLSAQLGETIEKERIRLESPIKKVGTYLIPIHLYKGISTEVRVNVEGKTEEAEAAEAEQE